MRSRAGTIIPHSGFVGQCRLKLLNLAFKVSTGLGKEAILTPHNIAQGEVQEDNQPPAPDSAAVPSAEQTQDRPGEAETGQARVRHRPRRVADPNDTWDIRGETAMPQPSKSSRRKRKARLASSETASQGSESSGAIPETPTSEPNGATATLTPDAVPVDDPVAATEALVVDLHSKDKRGNRTLERIRRKQQTAAVAVAASDDNPALGALNRHLNLLLQQLATAHRVIGRVAAERDALRQQLAELQGVPVEKIQVTNVALAPQPAEKTQQPQPEEPQTTSLMARLNYFGHEDIAVARKRRQTFVLVLALIIVIVALVARQLNMSIDRMSKDTLSALPIIGNLVSVLLAGWLLYRIVRISSKGIKWVFPSDDRKRRRR